MLESCDIRSKSSTTNKQTPQKSTYKKWASAVA